MQAIGIHGSFASATKIASSCRLDDGDLVLDCAFLCRIAGKSFESTPKAPRQGRTLINSTEFASRKLYSGKNQHVVAANSKQ